MVKRLLVLAIVCFVVVGFFRGWYQVSSTRTPDTTDVNFSIDKGKMRDDAQRANTRVQEARNQTIH